MTLDKEHFRRAMFPTPFAERTDPLSQVQEWYSWNGYKVARVLDQLSNEYFAVRSGCSIMDMTPMEKYRIRGGDSRRFLDRLVTRNISSLRPGRVTYVVWCNDEGKVIDDGTLYQLGEDDYRLCAQHHQLDWLLMSAAGFDVSIDVETHDIAALAVQGPTSCSVLMAAGLLGLDQLRSFDAATLAWSGLDVFVSRTGYTGDLGYELWLRPDDALPVWDAIFAMRGDYDIVPIGVSALEIVRTEAGFIMPGFDFNTAESVLRAGYDRSPFEVGLDWVVDLEKGHFTGRRALIAERQRPPGRRFHKLVVAGNKPAADATVCDRKGGSKVGELKAAVWSPILKKNIALADIVYRDGRPPAELWARIDYQKELEWNTQWARCAIVDKPFLVPEHKLLTPPAKL